MVFQSADDGGGIEGAKWSRGVSSDGVPCLRVASEERWS